MVNEELHYFIKERFFGLEVSVASNKCIVIHLFLVFIAHIWEYGFDDFFD